MKPGVISKDIYLPKTSDWIDFYTIKKYKGGQTISVEVNKESIPTFVRSGSIIPMTKSLQHTKEYDGNTLEIHYYYDAESDNAELILYNDDGLTQDAFQKEFEMLKFKIKKEESSITILCSADTGNNYETEQKRIDFVIHNLDKKISQTEIIDGELPIKIDSVLNKITTSFIWDTDSNEKITLEYLN